MDVRRSPIRPLVKVQSYRDRWVRSTRAGRADQDKWEWGSRVVWWENHATWWESHDSWLARNSAWQNAEAEDEEIRRMEEGSGVGNLEHQLSVDAEENRRINEQKEGSGVANLSRFDAAFAAWQASQDAAYETWQASQRRIVATAIAEYPLRVDAAFEAWQQRQYDRLLLYYQLGWKTKVLLVAVRMGHLLKTLDGCERCKMMQLGISWWREVCVFPTIFVNESSLNYLEVIQSDRLGALQLATPLAKGLTTLRPIGHHVIDGKLFHES